MNKRTFWTLILSLAFIGLFTIYWCNKKICLAAEGKLYSSEELIPYNKVGLLLGTSKYMGNGQLNFFYTYRIQAAVRLIKSKKLKYLVISGDNSRASYNEPQSMKDDLIKAGIDSSIIYLDYAGFRTYDSMIRLKEIFGQDSVTIISQKFHNQRALYIAAHEGIQAVAFNARDVHGSILSEQLREKLARVKVFIDYLTNKKPRFLGDKVLIP